MSTGRKQVVPNSVKLIIILALLGFAVLIGCVINLPRFNVLYVSVDSVSDDISENVREILMEPVGKSIFFVSSSGLEKKLNKQASVNGAEVQKVYPNKIKVTLI